MLKTLYVMLYDYLMLCKYHLCLRGALVVRCAVAKPLLVRTRLLLGRTRLLLGWTVGGIVKPPPWLADTSNSRNDRRISTIIALDALTLMTRYCTRVPSHGKTRYCLASYSFFVENSRLQSRVE